MRVLKTIFLFIASLLFCAMGLYLHSDVGIICQMIFLVGAILQSNFE